jgi:hypothetical protein
MNEEIVDPVASVKIDEGKAFVGAVKKYLAL